MPLGRALTRWLGQRRRPKRRRSRTRLAQAERESRYEQTTAAPGTTVWAPTKAKLRLNGNLAFNLVVLSLLGWGIAWSFASDRFYVDQVAVNGNQRISTETILGASGLRGYSIFWVDPRRVAVSIAESLPPIKRVKVQYSLPNTVTILVEERGDQVMWQVAGKRYWASDDGSLHPAQGGREPNLLVQDIRPGLPAQVETDALVAAQQIALLLPELRVIEYAPMTGLRFTHSRGWLVYLGTGDDMARKVSVLRAIETQLAGQETTERWLVDLRYPDSPYYRVLTRDAGGN